jgi:isoamylase
VKKYNIRPGSRYPPGAIVDCEGVNFSTFSRYATTVELLLYERADSPAPFQVIQLDSELNRTFYSWHVFVEDLPVGIHYTWRVDGPDDTRTSGFRFNKHRELLDPWARAVTQELWNRKLISQTEGESNASMRAIVIEPSYDWEEDHPLNHNPEDTLIYEMHVGGFTRYSSSNVASPGTFAGVIEKIPYLKELGVTDVELLPIMAFDEQDVPEEVASRGLKNYWGYSTHSFLSPHPGYCNTPKEGSHLQEFRDMVKALHKAGIGVILDVVFNHTAEGGADGPIINFKGFGNQTFYHLDSCDRSIYRDYTGCGNTVNCNHPMVASFIIECLEYWVREMHVDGFRFDLASVLARGEDGSPMQHPPVLWSIELSEVLAHTKIIAEAWDAAGLYQVGAFPGFRWAEWNGRYRDVIRRFVGGEKGLVAEVATRLSGSSDLYQPHGRLPINTINFVTCHDGFTLYDLVSYNEKHNEDNGEDNGDGTNENFSWNCGWEGETNDPLILSLRRRQAKNFMAILLLSQGVPMLLAGDEVLRSQRGNNNAYCQDNELGWFDWTLTEQNKDMFRFVKEMIAFRKRHACLRRKRFLKGEKGKGRHFADVTWHGAKVNEPPWEDPEAQLLAFTLSGVIGSEEDIHAVLNMSDTAQQVDLPPIPPGSTWFRAVDTCQDPPADILEPAEQLPLRNCSYTVQPRSVGIFERREG